MKKASVIVPFYNGTALLQLCLRALEQQSYPADSFEIIAVDNGSTEDTTALQKAFPKVRWLHESEPGSSCARNRGLADAQGEVVAFTDADCLPQRTWLEEAMRTLETTDATVVAGRVNYLEPEGRKLNAFELIEEKFFLLHRQKFLVEKLGVAATANLIAHRRIFSQIGGFDPDLLSFHDGDWVLRATAAGEKLAYADTVLVLHPRRTTFNGISKKTRRTAGDKIVLMRKQKRSVGHFVWDIFRYSPLSPLVHWTALFFPNAKGISQRVQLFFAVEILCFIATFERLRVLFGGRGHRG